MTSNEPTTARTARTAKAKATKAKEPTPNATLEQNIAMAKAQAARAAAKAMKRGRAADREAFYQQMHGNIDYVSLNTAVNRFRATESDSLSQADPPSGDGITGTARARPLSRDFPTSNESRWVPIGPTVTQRGQAMSRPRTSGRIRDINVSEDGQRAYVISAKGGVWYSGDAGTTWKPVGGWATGAVNPQGNGNMFSGGALLVSFGGISELDIVLVGTGEPVPSRGVTGETAQGGVGVLAARGPAIKSIEANPWEDDAGAGSLAGKGIYRLARDPLSAPFDTLGSTQDRVLAATTEGLYLGIRLPADDTSVPPKAERYEWKLCPLILPKVAVGGALQNDVDLSVRQITDVLWLRDSSHNRIVFTASGEGVFISDDNGATATRVADLQPANVAIAGRFTLAAVPGTPRAYVLGEIVTVVPPTGPPVVPPAAATLVPVPRLWKIVDVFADHSVVGTVTIVPVAPPTLFGVQGDYDQAMVVEFVDKRAGHPEDVDADRIFLGGSATKVTTPTQVDYCASLFCLETANPATSNSPLVPVKNISRIGNPPTGDGASAPGLIGRNVHPDVHVIKLVGPKEGPRHVWVGCDGGVYVSEQSGRVNTFASRNSGLATLEPIFFSNHPTSSHFVSAGFQDNGSQVRIGDTVWEETSEGDGGGIMIHPVRSDITIMQYIRGYWSGSPATDYVDPLSRHAGWYDTKKTGTEADAAAFYSGGAVIKDGTTARIAIGTNRVWLSDTIGTGNPTSWTTLPHPSGTSKDTRPNGVEDPTQLAFGRPGFNPGSDQVIDMVWQKPSELLVAFQGGLVRYSNSNKAAGTWSTTTWTLPAGPIPADALITSVTNVPESLDFYVSTLGDASEPGVDTLFFYNNSTSTFIPTGLRGTLGGAAHFRDPCFAVIVHPNNPNELYVGTATGVYKGTKTEAAKWEFKTFRNGLPQATAQDLEIWQDPDKLPGRPILLRVAMQSRGIWEVDLSNSESRRTYVRVHSFDDRRILPTPMDNPRRRPKSPIEPVFASPDIVVRPAWPFAKSPKFKGPLSAGNTAKGNIRVYDLWTFQTAFRWLYPSCVANGEWSDAMDALIRFHRETSGLSAESLIDEDLWNLIMGGKVKKGSNQGDQPGVRLVRDPSFFDRATVTTTDQTQPLAVYRPTWHSTLNFNGHATEIDLLETVQPINAKAGTWLVHNEPSTIDVLLHHRDSRPVAAGHSFALLLWREAASVNELLKTNWTDIPAFLTAAIAAGTGTPPTSPTGWTAASNDAGVILRTLTTEVDARLPRAVSIDVDLSTVKSGRHVMFLALVGSDVDDPFTPPLVAPKDLSEFVRLWPAAALRIVQVTKRKP
jgi:hypothetical protein